MAPMCRTRSYSQLGEVRFVEPTRHGVLEHAARPAIETEVKWLYCIGLRCTSPGDDKHESVPARLRIAQEAQQCAMRGGSGVAMEIEFRARLDKAAAQSLVRCAIKAAR